MTNFPCIFSQLLLKLFFVLSVLVLVSKAQPKQRPFNNTVPAIFVFGDSTVDSGNNNYIRTLMKSNFPPYGRDFYNHIPTGRFTNGRLVTDFIASYVGVKDYVPAYLDPALTPQDLLTGVSFASAGSGFDPLTATISMVIPIEKQVENFREYKTKIEQYMGKEGTQNLINQSVFIVSASTNDYVINYFGVGSPVRQQSYPTVSSYQDFLMQNIQKFIQELLDEGATKIAMVGVPPMGCLPEVITLDSSSRFRNRTCVDTLSSVGIDHNNILQNKLKSMQNNNTMLLYADIYKPLSAMIQQQDKFGFDDLNSGCCGTGYFEASILCNPSFPVCDDASKYIFWDAIHPTESAYYFIFTSLLPVVDQFIRN